MNDDSLAHKLTASIEQIQRLRLALLQENTCYHYCQRGRHIIGSHESCDDARCAAIEAQMMKRVLICLKCVEEDRHG